MRHNVFRDVGWTLHQPRYEFLANPKSAGKLFVRALGINGNSSKREKRINSFGIEPYCKRSGRNEADIVGRYKGEGVNSKNRFALPFMAEGGGVELSLYKFLS